MLVGNTAQVVASTDKSLVGRAGTVVGETKNMMILLVRQGMFVRIPKTVVTLRVRTRLGRELQLEGAHLVGTPADRIKN